MATTFPGRNQKAPNFWDVQLKAWIEEAPLAGGAFATALLEAVQDILGTSLLATGATVAYNDTTGKTTITVTGGGSSSTDVEVVRDTIAAALVQGSGITIVANDGADTITISVADGALSIAKTSGLQAALDAKAALALSINVQTGTSYTPVLADGMNRLVTLNNASAITYAVPLNSSVAYPIGSSLLLCQLGAGQVTLVGVSGVTLTSRGAALKTAGQGALVELIKIAADTWLVTGDVTT